MFNFHYSKYLILDLIFLYVPRPSPRDRALDLLLGVELKGEQAAAQQHEAPRSIFSNSVLLASCFGRQLARGAHSRLRRNRSSQSNLFE